MRAQNGRHSITTTISEDLNDRAPQFDGSEGPEIKRREFCSRLLLTSSGLLVAGSLLTGKASGQPGFQVAYPPQRIDGAERLMPGAALYFNYPTHTEPAILVRNVDGEYYAYNCRCSHLGCSVYFERATKHLECPCHKGAYDLQSGFVLNGPPTRALNQILLYMKAGVELWAVGRTISRDNPNG